MSVHSMPSNIQSKLWARVALLCCLAPLVGLVGCDHKVARPGWAGSNAQIEWSKSLVGIMVAQDCDTSVVDSSGKVGGLSVGYESSGATGVMTVKMKADRDLFLNHDALYPDFEIKKDVEYKITLTQFYATGTACKFVAGFAIQPAQGSVPTNFDVHRELVSGGGSYRAFTTEGGNYQFRLWLDHYGVETVLSFSHQKVQEGLHFVLVDTKRNPNGARPGLRAAYSSNQGDDIKIELYAQGNQNISHPTFGVHQITGATGIGPSAIIELKLNGNINPASLSLNLDPNARVPRPSRVLEDPAVSLIGSYSRKVPNRIRLEVQDEKTSALWITVRGQETCFLVSRVRDCP